MVNQIRTHKKRSGRSEDRPLHNHSDMALRRNCFSKPYPVRTTVGSHLGHTPGVLVELDCIAYAPAKTEKKQPRATKRKSAKRRR